PRDEVRSDRDVMPDLAKRSGPHGFSADSQEVFDELTRASQGGKADYRGISYERIAAGDGVFWPCPSAVYPDTPRLFAEDFPTPDRRRPLPPLGDPGEPAPPQDHLPHFLATAPPFPPAPSERQTPPAPALPAAPP